MAIDTIIEVSLWVHSVDSDGIEVEQRMQDGQVAEACCGHWWSVPVAICEVRAGLALEQQLCCIVLFAS